MEIVKLPLSEWESYRNLRLKALIEDPQAFGASYEDNSKYTEEEWKRRLGKAYDGKTNWLLFARQDSKLVGMVGAYIDKGVKDTATVISVFVPKEERGKQISTKLMGKLLLELSNNESLKKVELTVNTLQKPAITLYKKFGFKETGIQKFKMGDGKFANEFKMERNLPYIKY